MSELHILGTDKESAWTDWSGRGFRTKSIARCLAQACPSMGLTERKRLAQKISDGEPLFFRIEHPERLSNLPHILESTGILFSIREKKSQPSGPENPIPSGTSDAKASGVPDSRGL
jgi:hypothetical protein